MTYAPLIHLNDRTLAVTRYLAQLTSHPGMQNGSDRAVLMAVAILGDTTAEAVARIVGQARSTTNGKLAGWEAVGVLRRSVIKASPSSTPPLPQLTWWSLDPAWLRAAIR